MTQELSRLEDVNAFIDDMDAAALLAEGVVADDATDADFALLRGQDGGLADGRRDTDGDGDDDDADADPAAPAAGAAAAPKKAKAPPEGQKKKKKPAGVRVATIDNFQGEEAQIIVLSLVRCNPQGIIGFLSDPGRVNVALSRARDAMVVIGSAATLRNSRNKAGAQMWDGILSQLKRTNAVCVRDATTLQLSAPPPFPPARPPTHDPRPPQTHKRAHRPSARTRTALCSCAVQKAAPAVCCFV
jgi:hypothetical protein